MVKVTLVAGLPGSGKSSWIAQTLIPELQKTQPGVQGSDVINSEKASIGNGGVFVSHDFKKETLDGTAQFSSSRCFGELIEALKMGYHAAIDDIGFCHPEARKWANRDILSALGDSVDIKIDWVFFENTVGTIERCEANIRRRALVESGRDTEKELAYLHKWANRYTPPKGARVIEVWAGR